MSVGIFAVIYFTVIKPTTDTANDVIRKSLHESQQQLHQAKKNAPDAQSKKQLSQAEKLDRVPPGRGHRRQQGPGLPGEVHAVA